jgi:hypothetical protein
MDRISQNYLGTLGLGFFSVLPYSATPTGLLPESNWSIVSSLPLDWAGWTPKDDSKPFVRGHCRLGRYVGTNPPILPNDRKQRHSNFSL